MPPSAIPVFRIRRELFGRKGLRVDDLGSFVGVLVLAWREIWVLVQEWLSRIPDFRIKLSTQMLGIGMLSRVPGPELVQF